ncbi:replication protein [Oceanobacillus halophilus]|uniref:Bacteriophage lambda Replication protein O N-terminal domain-containing protein n=1 Tax=Oceanobacillus halophilus TaxID=930130 RepID=A0A495A0N4_9BACI|nr:replication protein [Oceanobacillus halophilus]RKQ32308.1 hypothetical protein D8M06_13080 [Oceanobacillus halophilus]
MANVQLENGYTMIANEILEEISKIKLSPTQYRLLFIIWRYTYGFNRRWHNMSLSFLSKATGCDSRQIQRELKRLEDRRVILQKIKSGSYRKITFNKNHDEWIGKTTNGKKANGEKDNRTFGEITNESIGEIDNQEIHKDKSKERDDQFKKSAPLLEYEKAFGNPSIDWKNKLEYWIKSSNFHEPEEIICETINRANMHKPDNPETYINAILKKLHDKGLYTLAAVEDYNYHFDTRLKNKKDGGVPRLKDMFSNQGRNKIVTKKDIREIEVLEEELPF